MATKRSYREDNNGNNGDENTKTKMLGVGNKKAYR